MTIALIIAGGRGTRMKNEVPKQFLTVNDKPVIIWTLEAFEKCADIDAIAVVCLEGWHDALRDYAKDYGISKLKFVIQAGENGQDSIRNGVFELEKHFSADDIVLVHDAIRPMVSQEIIKDCIEKCKEFGTALASIPCQEAMTTCDGTEVATGIYPREKLRRTQTPQGFRLKKICDLHRLALEKGILNSVASCTLLNEVAGENMHFSLGSEKNIKLTTREDLDIFKALLEKRK